MKLTVRILCLFIALYSLEVEADNLTLWYNSPASAWEEALPVGNGRLGAMVLDIQTANVFSLMKIHYIVAVLKNHLIYRYNRN